MKKLLITSLCTLVLSLSGVIGASQNSMNLGNLMNSERYTTNVVENITNSDQQSPASDYQTKMEATVTEASDMNINKVATPTNSNLAVKPETGVLSASVTLPSKSKTITYKNVDLSKCKSISDVVKVLRKNGYTNITKKNVTEIKGLKAVLGKIKAKNCKTGTVTSTVAPTKAPTSTVAPTKAPASTEAPTKAPTSSTKPTVMPTATPSTSAKTSGISSYAGEVLKLVNAERAKAGLSELTTNSSITAAANKRAQETTQSFSHTRPNGSGFSTVLTEYGVSFRAAGENIAYGQKTPQEVVTAWMNSAGHRANILNSNFGKIGIGVYQSNGVIYWAQEFTN